jgi:hypothetical protein
MEQVARATNLCAAHQPYENWMFLIVRVACGSCVLSALQVWLSYISLTRYVHVYESYNARTTHSLPLQDWRTVNLQHLLPPWGLSRINDRASWSSFAKVNCLFRECTFTHLRFLLLNCSGNNCLLLSVMWSDIRIVILWLYICLIYTNFPIVNWYLELSPEFTILLTLFHWLI